MQAARRHRFYDHIDLKRQQRQKQKYHTTLTKLDPASGCLKSTDDKVDTEPALPTTRISKPLESGPPLPGAILSGHEGTDWCPVSAEQNELFQKYKIQPRFVPGPSLTDEVGHNYKYIITSKLGTVPTTRWNWCITRQPLWLSIKGDDADGIAMNLPHISAMKKQTKNVEGQSHNVAHITGRCPQH